MSKRKLTQQQKRRVHKQRQKQTTSNAPNSNSKLGQEQSGLVITSYGKHVLVESKTGEHYHCAIRQHLGKLVAGDHVIWQTDIEAYTGIVTQLLPRKHELSRPGFRGQTRMIAANIDFIGIVMPVLPGILPDMIDRYLVAASQLNIPAIIIINKVDLLSHETDWEEVAMLLTPYESLNIELIPASTISHTGLNQLQAFMNQKTTVLVGPSGAGKSSLINALIPDLDIRIGALSQATGLGKHTTSNSILYHLPPLEPKQSHGGHLIDSPGIRQFSPTPCSLSELEKHYPDFSPYLGLCKFNNCRHNLEPHCAIQEAVKEGSIAPSRYLSFQRLLTEFSTQQK